MLDNGVVVMKVSEVPEYGRDGTRTAFVRVEFTVDKHGPFTERFPKDGYTAMVRDNKLNAFAREVR